MKYYIKSKTSIIEITNLNVEGCKSYLPVFSIICQYFPVNATGMANLLIFGIWHTSGLPGTVYDVRLKLNNLFVV